jgi:hypothetical protein
VLRKNFFATNYTDFRYLEKKFVTIREIRGEAFEFLGVVTTWVSYMLASFDKQIIKKYLRQLNDGGMTLTRL